jgi:hypothetical protein
MTSIGALPGKDNAYIFAYTGAVDEKSILILQDIWKVSKHEYNIFWKIEAHFSSCPARRSVAE